ncbi:serine carboxypeptidase [Phakopsora pachyrhizi]|nr:serine carboxypeptidase [Phakopsora pachyrhizi]
MIVTIIIISLNISCLSNHQLEPSSTTSQSEKNTQAVRNSRLGRRLLNSPDNNNKPSTSTPLVSNSGNISDHQKLRLRQLPSLCNEPNGGESFSGFIDLDRNRSMFFWFFPARLDTDRAPLVLWLNGGPGSSSMIGLFQEHGPCRVRRDSSGLDHNPESWNQNFLFRLYLDQPIGVGYSTGFKNVSTSIEAAVDVYDALQIFLSHTSFSKLSGRSFGLWTESYGGRYGPIFLGYFLKMNAEALKNSTNTRVIIPIKSLGIGNGLIDPISQYLAYVTYAQDNPYRPNLVSGDIIEKANLQFSRPGGCKDQLNECNTKNDDPICNRALTFCDDKMMTNMSGGRDVYDVRSPSPPIYPPNLTVILNEPRLKSQIGVPINFNWSEGNDEVFGNFLTTGDGARSTVKELEEIVNAGIRTLIYAGDADFIVNYHGVESVINNLNTKFKDRFVKQKLEDWIVEGQLAGKFKTVENLSYIRVLEAGHEVPAYGKGTLAVGRAARIFFEQTISDKPISGEKNEKISSSSSNGVISKNGLRVITLWLGSSSIGIQFLSWFLL